MAEELKEYVVTLHRRENLEEFYEDMETPGGALYIPNRKVDCANRREISRNTHYYLTQEEALQLKNDPRVRGVDPLDMLTLTPLWEEYNENFEKNPFQSQDLNWALLRCIEGNHRTEWSGFTSDSDPTAQEGYVFAYREGENVDVVIFDGIIDPTHPEFAVNSDGTGGSRVIREDWWQYIPSKTTAYPYTDIKASSISNSEHGQHVAGTVAGNRQGWARKASIYNIDVYNTSLGEFGVYGWDAVRAWHAAKPINPATGRKNPTVTNHSYGFQINTKIDQISRIKYRGIVYFNPIKNPSRVGRPDNVAVNFQDWTSAEWEEKGFRGLSLGSGPEYSSLYGIGFPAVAGVTDQEDAMNEGIFVVAAGGNGKNILALPGDPDYDNSITTDVYFFGIAPLNYCRGMGHSYDSILVGNIGIERGSDSTKEALSDSSAKGRGITVFAPGTNIFSAGYTGSIQDPRNPAYRLVNKTGTSMASPQVAGIVACTMEKHYTATPAQMKQYIIDNAKTGQISENDVVGRGKALFTLTGTPDRYLFYPSDLNEDAPVSYTITPSSASVNEGQSVTFNISSQYVSIGTVVNWRIISSLGTLTASDFADGILQGNLTINKQADSITKTLAEDFTTEGNESFALELSAPGGTVLATSSPVTVVDTSRDPVYDIAANKSSMGEGDSITFTLTTQGVQNNTTLYWTAQGSVNGSDFSQGASGTVLITGSTSSGMGSFSLTTTEDRLTESSESFRIYLRTGSLSGTLVATSDEITISDTSRNPTYSIVSDKSNINEGEVVTFTVSTTDVPNNTTLYWTTTGAASSSDFSDNTLSGSVLITGTSANGTGTVTRTVIEDRLTEGFESFILNLKIGSTSGGTVATSGGVIVTDTSLSPTYTLSVDKNSTTESSNIIITLRTTDVDNNTLVPYVIYGNGIDPTDFLDIIQLTGNFNVTANTATLILDINPDVATEGTETAYLALTGTGRDEKIGFVIQDTSTAPPSNIVKFYISSSASSIREGSYLTFNIDATGVDTNLTVPYELLGIAAADLLDPSQIRGNIVLTYDPFAIISPRGAGVVSSPILSGTDADPEYNNGAIINVVGDGSDFFKREVTVNGVRIVAAGTVGGQAAVPDAWLEKVARMFELFLDPNGAGINETAQRNVIKTLSGDAGTYHAAQGPTLQRVARGAGSDYTPNFLTDEGIASWNLSPLFDSHVANDMVWYLNSTGDGYGIGEIDAQEVIEHVFHTLHMHGLDAVSLKMYPYISADWATGPLYNAMVEAYDGGYWDPAGYGGAAFKTDGDAFEVAAKEYLYLLNFSMFEYTGLWDGDSLAPEWTDTVRTSSQIQTNLPLGYALHNTYIAPVISKPSLATINSIFGNGNTPAQDNPALAGASGYIVDVVVVGSPTLTLAAGTGVASGSLTIGVLENFRTDGLRTVFLSLTPDFSYEVEVNSTITIIDTSPGTDPAYTFTLDKYSVIEGQNVEVTVTTTNVADNTIITANIIPFENAKIQVSDFVGLDKLLIEFPPTSGNTTSYTLQTADDFIFEQSEYFYLGITGTTFTSGTIEILDSGNTLIESVETYTGNISIRFLDKALLEPDLGGFTIGKSTWEDTAGMLSEKVFVQGKTPYSGPGAPPFYQPFSYVIRSNKSIELWRNSIKDIIHPAGLALFSEISNETQFLDRQKVSANVSLDSEISDFFALTADSQKPPFYVSSNLYSNSRFEIPLKSDFAYYIHRYF